MEELFEIRHFGSRVLRGYYFETCGDVLLQASPALRSGQVAESGAASATSRNAWAVAPHL